MSDEAKDIAEQFEKAFNTPKQSWLLAAGASFMSNIPLMYPLTRRVLELARTEAFKDEDEVLSTIEFIEGDIDQNAHIEIFLTHLADLISMSVRSRDHSAQLGDTKVSFDVLTKLHWHAPIGWSGLIVSASSVSGPSGRLFPGRVGGSPERCAA